MTYNPTRPSACADAGGSGRRALLHAELDHGLPDRQRVWLRHQERLHVCRCRRGRTPDRAVRATGVPVTVNQTGIRSFCSFEDAVVRVQPTGAAIATVAGLPSSAPLNQ